MFLLCGLMTRLGQFYHTGSSVNKFQNVVGGQNTPSSRFACAYLRSVVETGESEHLAPAWPVSTYRTVFYQCILYTVPYCTVPVRT